MNLASLRSLILPLFTLTLCACEPSEEALDLGPDRSASPTSTDRGGASLPTLDRASPPPAGDVVQSYIILRDTTEGFAIDELFGSEIDAVSWRCPDDRGSGYAISIVDEERPSSASGFSLDPILGPPDGPCPDDLTRCGGFLGLEGLVVVGVAAADLRGCEILVHELADNRDESYIIIPCSTPDRCNVVWENGSDGTASGGRYE